MDTCRKRCSRRLKKWDMPAGYLITRWLAAGPFLLAERFEDPAFPTVLTYGHGDVVLGYDDQWREGLSPWTITQDGDRLYGRGTADNKGQHSINIAAFADGSGIARPAGLQFEAID